VIIKASLLALTVGMVAPIMPVAPQTMPASTRQVITITADGSGKAVGARYELRASQWIKVGNTFAARTSTKGLIDIADRVRNTGTTPLGSFSIGSAFGFEKKPATKVNYRRATSASWWVADPASPLDDTWQECAKNCSWKAAEGERLIDHRDSYSLAISINTKNSKHAAAIFLHLDTGKPLSGCVAISRATMVELLKWLDPKASPVIQIVKSQDAA